MKSILHCLSAEILKMRRTLAILLCAIAPLIIGAIVVSMYLRDANYFLNWTMLNPWDQLGQMCLVYWNLLFIPLFIPLLTALLAQFEHNRHNWKLIYTLPNPRWSTYLAKWLVVQGLLLGCLVEILVMIFLSGKLLNVFNSGYGFSAAFPLWEFCKLAGISFLACWILVSLHMWIGIRFSSFPMALGVGIFAMVGALFIFGQDISYYYPWTLPGITIVDVKDGILHMMPMFIGCLGGITLAILSMYDLSHIEVYQ
jgi:hypothetical protein